MASPVESSHEGVVATGHRADPTEESTCNHKEVERADQTALPLLKGVLFVQGTLARVGSSYTK
jgi:hypothetical protein